MSSKASRGSVRLGGDGKGGAKGGAGGGAAANGTATPGADGAGDDLLPRLPIPDLSATCDRFLEVVAPLLSEKELEETKVVVDDFRRPGGEGEALQSDLKAYDALGVEEGGAHSFVEEFWHHAYLAGRAPLPVHTNPFFVLEDDPTPSRNSQIMRATSLIFSSLKFCYAVRSGVLEPDTFKKRPLDMSQYAHLFGSSRVPCLGCDKVVVSSESTHLVVMCRGQIYWFDVLTPDGSLAVTQESIAENLRAIRADSARLGPDCALSAVGLLTSENRDVWARARQSLEAVDECNRESLELMDSALFVVCLDDIVPDSLTQQSANILHGISRLDADGQQVGTCINRWHDKSLQVIVAENGSAGINFEHSYLDGHTVLRFASDVFTDTILRFAATIRGGLSITKTLPDVPVDVGTVDTSPRRIVWRLAPDFTHAVRRAESKISDLISQTEVLALEYGGFGKRFIIQHNLSPDAVVQLSYQLAYFTLYGELRNTYETVMTKHFRHGRTEAMRCATHEAHNFVHTFHSPAAPQAKADALRRAVRAQVKGVRACAKGEGCERHLYALLCIAGRRSGAGGEDSKGGDAGDRGGKSGAVPELFRTHAYDLLTRSTISTSNCGNPSLRLFGFGPVQEDGFGIGYIIKSDGIQFCASSRRRQTQRFLFTLQQCLEGIRQLLEATSDAPKPTATLPVGSVRLGHPIGSAGDGAVRPTGAKKRPRGESLPGTAPPIMRHFSSAGGDDGKLRPA